ncbi:MAG: receptor, partial [Candidatus Nephrothrix sp. EaCA]
VQFSKAQNVMEICDAIDETAFGANALSFFRDDKNTLTFEQVSSPQFSNSFALNTQYKNLDYVSKSPYWLRLYVRHNPATKKMWLLEFCDQSIDHIEAYIPQACGYEKALLGDQELFSSRLIPHKNFEVPLHMKKDTVMAYYFKIQSSHFADLRVALRSLNRFISYAVLEYYLFGIFYGMVLIIALYNLLTFFVMKEWKYVYYVFYITSVALYAMSLDGIGFQYLWPAFPWFNNLASPIFLCGVIVCAIVFSKHFLNLRAAPGANRVFNMLIAARIAMLLAGLLFCSPILNQRFLDAITLSVIFYVSIVRWRAGYKPARFFVVSYGVLFTAFLVRALVYFNLLPFSTFIHYTLHYGFLSEMLFLTLALADRVRILKANRNRAMKRILQQQTVNLQLKNKVNEELEDKVAERTAELQTKNEELEALNAKMQRQSTAINQINSMLDLDNWKLKNRMKEVLNEMLNEKTMNYQEFQTLYPDELSCYRFLEEVKWKEGYVCHKCKNQKFFVGAQKFARRCTRCGYNESITAFTIFQGIKFPIEKAFYIAYLCVSANNELTLEALSKQLSIGLNTAWAFRHKTLERLNEMKESGKSPSASRWEEVISNPSKVRKKKPPPPPP